MDESIHHIGSHRFEVQLFDESKAHEVQERLMNVIKLRVMDTMERVFDETCPADVKIRIPKIEIDLGELDLLRIESDLEYRLRQELSKYLSKTVEEIRAGNISEAEMITSVHSKKELITVFLSTGTLPWWAPDTLHTQSFSLIDDLEELYEKEPRELLKLIEESVSQSVMLHRLITQLDHEGLLKLIRFYEKGRESVIQTIISEIKFLHQLSVIKKQTGKDLESIFWVETLKLIALKQPELPDADELLHKVMQALAKKEMLDFKEFVAALHEELRGSSAVAPVMITISTFINEQVTPSKTKQLKTGTSSSTTDRQVEVPQTQLADQPAISLEDDEQQTLEEAKHGELSKAQSQISEDLAEVRIKLSFGEVSLQELIFDWPQRSRRLRWIQRLTEEDSWAIIKVQAQTTAVFNELQQVVKEMIMLVEQNYKKSITTESVRQVVFEMILDPMLQEAKPVTVKVDELIRQFVQLLSKKLSVPVAFVEETIRSTIDVPSLIKALPAPPQELQQDIVKDDEEAIHYNDAIIRHFFVYGIYPSTHIPSIEKYVTSFVEEFPDRLQRIIHEFTPVQMVRLVLRIAQEFSEAAKNIILPRIHAIRAVVLQDSVKVVGRIELSEVTKRADDVVYVIQQWLLTTEMGATVSFTLDEILEAFIKEFPGESKAFLKSLPSADLSLLLEYVTPSKGHEPQESRLPEIILKLVDEDISTTAGAEDKPLAPQQAKGTETGIVEVEGRESVDDAVPREPVYIKNAGLVVLYPFLSRYFRLLGLLAEDRKGFKDEHSVQKAVHLLHFLAYGEQQGREYQMTLNKLICGMPFAVPVERDISLTKEELEMSESLLKGVIQNWEIIKSSSVANFRGSFLIREGRLENKEQAWFIKVEQRAYDMLLDKIPWSFNVIKLPWMKKAIHVEWR